jgi:heme oxygenase
MRAVQGRRFFADYGADTGAMWSQFCTSLDHIANKHEGFATLAAGAARRTLG